MFALKTLNHLKVQLVQFNKSSIRWTLNSSSKSTSKTALQRKLQVFVVGTTLLIPGAWYLQSTAQEKRKARVTIQGISRFLRYEFGSKLNGFFSQFVIFFNRSLVIGATISTDYWWSLRNIDEDSEDYIAKLKEVHQRTADRILAGCLKNGGLYIKLGQGLVSMNHILPKEYLETLKVLQDRCLVRGSTEIEQLFDEEFGKSHKELFLSFEEEPIAAASLAQVCNIIF